MIDLEYKTTSTVWKRAYEFIWCVGMIALFIYTYASWPGYHGNLPLDEYYVQFLIYGIFYLGMAGARWRYFQYKNIRMFCITLGGSLFICVMVLRELDVVGQLILDLSVWVYFISMVIVLFSSRKSR